MEPDYRRIALAKLLREHARHLNAVAQAFDDAKPIPTFEQLADEQMDFRQLLLRCCTGQFDVALGGKPE